MEQQVVLVTGASSGIGRETAILMARTGHVVYGAARRLDKLQELSKYGVIPLVLDVTKDYSCQNALQQILNQHGTLDILINNAGYGSYGAVEDVPLAEARHQMEVNVFGAIRLTRMVLPLFRRQHRGRVIMVSSIAGRVTGPFGGLVSCQQICSGSPQRCPADGNRRPGNPGEHCGTGAGADGLGPHCR